jgi:V/A-type H+-transporting ATPase subunit E
MSLDALLDAIRREGDSRVQAVETQAQAEAEALLAAAQAESQRLFDRARAAEVTAAHRERARILQNARLEAVKITGEAREALFQSILERTRARLAQARSDTAYPSVLHDLVEEALRELGQSLRDGESALVEIDRRDRAAVKAILENPGGSFTLKEPLETWGGVVVRSPDGRVIVTNTLESRLEHAGPYLRRHVLKALGELDAAPEDTS